MSDDIISDRSFNITSNISVNTSNHNESEQESVSAEIVLETIPVVNIGINANTK
jgi:hypothetical protein